MVVMMFFVTGCGAANQDQDISGEANQDQDISGEANQEQDISGAANQEQEVRGNTVGNIVNLGLAALQGEWI